MPDGAALAPGHIVANSLTVYFTPTPNSNGNPLATFFYRVLDGELTSENVGSVAIFVTAVNDPPMATLPPFLTTPEDTTLAFRFEGFDVENNAFLIEITDLGNVQSMLYHMNPPAGLPPGQLVTNSYLDLGGENNIDAEGWRMELRPFRDDCEPTGTFFQLQYRFSDNRNPISFYPIYQVDFRITCVNDFPTVSVLDGTGQFYPPATTHTFTTTLLEGNSYSLGEIQFADVDIGSNIATAVATSTVGTVGFDAFTIFPAGDCGATVDVSNPNSVSLQQRADIPSSDPCSLTSLMQGFRYTAGDVSDSTTSLDDTLVVRFEDGGASGECPAGEGGPGPCTLAATTTVQINYNDNPGSPEFGGAMALTD